MYKCLYVRILFWMQRYEENAVYMTKLVLNSVNPPFI